MTAQPAADQPAVLPLRPRQVLTVAGAADNVFRVLQTLPGVAATEEFGSRLSVRGGGPDQNLTVMDGVEIHNPYRLFGLTSAFNPETVERFELTAGGFGAKYGDRLSSLLVVENRPGDADRGFSGLVRAQPHRRERGRRGQAAQGASGLLAADRPPHVLRPGGRALRGRPTCPRFNDVQGSARWELRPGPAGSPSPASAAARTRTRPSTTTGPASAATSSPARATTWRRARFHAPLGAAASPPTPSLAWYRNTDALDVDARVRRTGAAARTRPATARSASPTSSSTAQISVRDLLAAPGPRRRPADVTRWRRASSCTGCGPASAS